MLVHTLNWHAEDVPGIDEIMPNLAHVLGDGKTQRRARQPIAVPTSDSKGHALSQNELKSLRRYVVS